MKLGLLLCDHVRSGFRVVSGDYPEFFGELFAGFPTIEIEAFDLTAGEFPTDLDRCDAWITSGSRQSVYDDIDWIRRFADLVQRLDAERRKLVGICFGAQMIGHALGGEVRRSEHGWQVGIKRVSVIEEEPWMDPFASSFAILHGNADQIVSPPGRMRILGSSETVPVSIVAVEEHMIGFQGHPEFNNAYASVLMESRRGILIPDDVVDAGLASLEQKPDTDLLASWIAKFLTSESEGGSRKSEARRQTPDAKRKVLREADRGGGGPRATLRPET